MVAKEINAYMDINVERFQTHIIHVKLDKYGLKHVQKIV